jgi:uncharacterized membrane protein
MGYLIVIVFSIMGLYSSWHEPGHENSLWSAILLLSFCTMVDRFVDRRVGRRQFKELESRIAKLESKNSATQS